MCQCDIAMLGVNAHLRLMSVSRHQKLQSNGESYEHFPQFIIRNISIRHGKMGLAVGSVDFAHGPVRGLTLPEVNKLIEGVHGTPEPESGQIVQRPACSEYMLGWKRKLFLLSKDSKDR